MNNTVEYALGIDLGGSSVKSVAVAPDGTPFAQRSVHFQDDASRSWAAAIRDLVANLQSEQGRPARWLGLSAPGLAAEDGRSVALMPGRLEGLVGLNWTTHLGFGSAVPVLNDAHAALLGEVWVGAARGLRNVVLLTLGTGVGGAAMVDGRLIRGHSGKAGHLGHVCLDPAGPRDVTGMPGSLETAFGNCTIRERSGGRYETTHDLVAAHQAGDATATAIWMQAVKRLACAIGSFGNILDPEVVVLGGGIARAGAALFEPLRPLVWDVEWRTGPEPLRIVAAELDEYAGAFGAAWNAINVARAATPPPG